MDDWVMLISMLMCFVAVAGSFAMFPYVSRKTVSFGVSIPEDIYRDSRVAALRRGYRNGILAAGVLCVAAMFIVLNVVSLDTAGETIVLGILIFAELFANGAIYLRAHNKMKALKEENDWNKDAPQLVTIDTGFYKKRTTVSPLWFIAYIIVMAGTVIVSLLRYDSLPSQIPMTFNEAGEAVGWMEKSYRVILYMPGIQLFLTVVMYFVYYSINKSRQQIDPANKEVSRMQNIIFRKRWSAFTVCCGLGMLVMFGIIQLMILGITVPSVAMTFSLALPLLIIVYIVVLAVTTGQSGSRVKVHGMDAPQKPIVREDDSNWKYGVWYYNPDDPSIFVEKRVGIGWTLNWGRPIAWVIMAGILALVAGSMIFSFTLGK